MNPEQIAAGLTEAECAHEWVERDDPHCLIARPVRCAKCGVLGEQSWETGEVDWPVT